MATPIESPDAVDRIVQILLEAQERMRQADRAVHTAIEVLLDVNAPHLTTEQLDVMWGKIQARMVTESLVRPTATHAVAFEGHPASLRDEPPSRPA